VMTTNTGNMELDNNARLEKRTWEQPHWLVRFRLRADQRLRSRRNSGDETVVRHFELNLSPSIDILTHEHKLSIRSFTAPGNLAFDAFNPA
jgi:hypothetical protein